MCRKIIKNLTCLILLCLFFLSFFFFVGRRETTWFLSIFLLVDCKCFMNKNRVLPQWVRRWVLTRRSGFRPLLSPLSNSHVQVCGLLACVSPLLLTCVSLYCPRLCESLKGPSPVAGIPKKMFHEQKKYCWKSEMTGVWGKGLPDVEIDLFFNTQSDFGV